ncbi:MAG: UbiD family decarboxylase, partial [Methanoregulaceae archaeon]|nr:UbiD family decarboxylase [Methanoregulaceae archaeon]
MRNFIERMRECGEVIDIDEPTDVVYDTCRLAHETDKLLFFHHLSGSRGVMNVTATRHALSLALDISPDEMVRRLSKAEYQGSVVRQGMLSMEPPNLGKIPIMKHYPGDAGKYITAGIVFSRFGDLENASIHRMQVINERKVAARLVEGRHTYTLHKTAMEQGKVLPVAVAIGVHPAVTFACCTRVPKGKELPYAAELLGGEIRVWQCGNGVLVPNAEIVLEGYIGAETTQEGPFVDITGTYDSVREQPIIEFTGMHIKPDFIYHGILPAGNEHRMLMGAPYEPSIFRAVSGVTETKNVILTTGG